MTEFPEKRYRGMPLDARLHLLDRQLLDEEDAPVGIVDDLELSGLDLDQDIAETADPPRVTGLLSGQVVATRIFGGSAPRSRLQEIPWEVVQSVGVVVKLKSTDVASDVSWVERWLRDHIVKRVPGGRHAAE